MKIALSVVALYFVFGSLAASSPDEVPTPRPNGSPYPNLTVRHEPAPEKARRMAIRAETPRAELPQQKGTSPKGGVVIQLDASYHAHAGGEDCHDQLVEAPSSSEGN